MEQYKNQMEECLNDLDLLNKLYDKDYCTIEEFQNIKNRIVDKMILISQQQRD